MKRLSSTRPVDVPLRLFTYVTCVTYVTGTPQVDHDPWTCRSCGFGTCADLQPIDAQGFKVDDVQSTQVGAECV